MAGRPRFATGAFHTKGSYFYSEAGLPDRQEWMSVGFGLRANIAQLDDEDILGSDAIAYADLYIRNQEAQDTCNCHFMEPWKRFNITKEKFLAAYDDGDSVRPVTHTDGTGATVTSQEWFRDFDRLVPNPTSRRLS